MSTHIDRRLQSRSCGTAAAQFRERRQLARLPFRHPARLSFIVGTQQERIPIRIGDISANGATLISPSDAPVDQLWLEFAADGRRMQIPLRILNRSVLREFESHPGPFYRLGVAFERKMSAVECSQALQAMR